MAIIFLCLSVQPLRGQLVPEKSFHYYAKESRQGYDAENVYYIIEWKDQLPKQVRMMRQLGERTAIVLVTGEAEYLKLSADMLIAPAKDEWKLSPGISFSELVGDGNERLFILSASDISLLQTALHRFPHVRVTAIDTASRSILVKTTGRILVNNLLPVPELVFADIKRIPHTETAIIGYNRGFHGISAVDYLLPGVNGKNVVAGVKEQKMEAADLDLYKRVLNSPLAASSVTNHATVIASIIGGSGNSFYDGRGMAHACSFFSSSFDNLFPDDLNILNTHNVSVQNHSYGTIVQQFYGAEAVSYDAQTWQQQQLVHVFSAGNRGTVAATEGRYAGITGFANLTGNFKMAKNIMAIAAIDNKELIPAESSSGPAYDGRMTPQLTALGPNGTSDAAAIVTSTAALLQQVYADSNSHTLPPASLVKALMYSTADDIYTKGIDYKTGFGLLNSFAAVRLLQNKGYDGSTVSNGQTWTKNITVPANAAQLKITLCWTDTSAAVNNLKALVNDLDLEVVAASTGTVYKPWVLGVFPHPDSLGGAAERRRDSLNTAEQVSISLPSPGIYEIKVKGTGVSSATVPFSIAYCIDSLNTFRFVSPVHTSEINRAEAPDLTIRWKTFVADTNQTGNLLISYDGGTAWHPVVNGIKIYRNRYSWPVKDTVSRAVLKMETSFGDFFSPGFIISPVCNPRVDFLCADSFGLSWNRHIYATGYKVYSLVDSPYLRHSFTVADTAIIMQRSQFPSMVWAVEPVTANGIPAARSIASDISLQGTKCFYRTLYYNLSLPGKAELVLELSSTAYTDSIFFEQISSTGIVIRRAGMTMVIANATEYRQMINDLPAGTSYWRAGVKLKNGSVVYTETISIQSAGTRFLLFYPNPADRNQPVHYFIQPGLPSDSRLQVFDISGRLTREYASLPSQFDFSNLPRGIYICKLISVDDKILGTEKLVIK